MYCLHGLLTNSMERYPSSRLFWVKLSLASHLDAVGVIGEEKVFCFGSSFFMRYNLTRTFFH